MTTKREEVLGPILERYMRGLSHRQIAEELNLTKQKVDSTLNSFRADFLATLSSRGIIPRYQHTRDFLDEVNREFFLLMSKPDQALSNEEMLYCVHYVSTGNSLQAVKMSGLDIGLEVNSQNTQEIYDKNCLLRSEMLKRKENIQREIRRLQKERQEYVEATKDRILEMHLEMIEQLREEGDPKNKSYIVKLLDQVNKMQGNYSIEVRSSQISADDVLDGMLEAAAVEKPKELQEAIKMIEDGDDYRSE